ncbi:ribbon-helix-helix protein, CopG family [Corynebacterium aquatimens]
MISFRLSPSEISNLDAYAASHGWSRSRAIREALKNAI